MGSFFHGWRTAGILLVLALVASGCFRNEVAGTVEADESGQLVITHLFTAEYVETREEDEFYDVDDDFEYFDQIMPGSAQISVVDDGDVYGRRAAIPFGSLAEFNQLAADLLINETAIGVSDDAPPGAFFGSFGATRAGSVFSFDAEYLELETVDEFIGGLDEEEGFEIDDGGEEIGSLGDYAVSIELPGAVTDHNADAVDGNLLSWEFPIEGPRTLTATSQIELVGGFIDVAGNTHAEAIVWVAERGITTGFPDDTFRPNDDVTRGQMATFLDRALDLPPGTATFSDVAGNVHAEAIAAVAEAGITTGFPDGTFRPNDPVTRGQMATFLFRALADA